MSLVLNKTSNTNSPTPYASLVGLNRNIGHKKDISLNSHTRFNLKYGLHFAVVFMDSHEWKSVGLLSFQDWLAVISWLPHKDD